MGYVDLNQLTPDEKIRRAKTLLSQDKPFFAYILLHFKIEADNNMPMKTMRINANGELFYDEDFVNSLSEEEIKAVLCHEVLHVALTHLERGEGKDRYLFNVANDLVVNDILVTENFHLPKNGLIPQWHTFERDGIIIKNINEKSSEEIYDELYKFKDQISPPEMNVYVEGGDSSESKGEGEEETKGENRNEGKIVLKGFDEHEYSKSNGDVTKESDRMNLDRQQAWKKIIAEAASVAKNQGKLPAGMERRVSDILDSKINWKTKLYKYVVSQIPFDYSWDRPSRRGLSIGTYLPRLMKESVKIVVSFDTSGSIGDEELAEFYSELKSIKDVFPNLNLDVIICDAEVHETYEFSQFNLEDLNGMKMSGGGGTSHIPVFDYIGENLSDIRVLINFTDGYTSFGEEPEGYDVLWVICKNGCSVKDVPFGEVIKIE